MDRIKKIFFSLSPTEVRYLKSYLTAFHARGKNRALEMIEILEEQPESDNKSVAETLYGDPHSKAFIMLKGRVLEKMLETLSLSVNFQNNPAFREDPAAFEAINLQKNLIYAFLLRRRGLEEQAREILEKCAKMAEDLSFPEYKLLALINLRNFSSSEKEVVWSYKQEIEDSLEQFRTDVIGSGIFDEFRVLQADSTSGDEEKEAYLTQKTLELEQRLDKMYSARSHYYYLAIKVYLHEFREEYSIVKQVLEEMIELLHSHPGIGSKNRLGIPLHQLSGVEVRMGNYTAAIQAADQALGYFHPHKRNYLSASIYKLFACIYANNLPEAHKTLENLNWFQNQKHLDSLNGIVSYLQACVLFIEGDYRKAQRVLFEATELLSDKAGWNVGIRVFEILILIDLDLSDLASAKIESLRKHIGKYEVEERIRLIYRYLNALERQSFDFREHNPEMEDTLRKLTTEAPWTALNHEVVRFESWVTAKTESGKFYTHLLRSLHIPTEK
ncbi:MAG: hypothetical protein SF052_24495 [Bacteroidia bacterium]|nr:hypothetical protein [Bacteroidia bacterium]